MSEPIKPDESPESVIIFSVGRKGNIVPGDISWPIIQKQEFISPSMFWNIIKVANKEREYYLQLNVSKRYLAPGGGRNSCILSEQPFAWKLEMKVGDVIIPFRISEASKPENVLQSGYRFENPPDAYAVVSQRASSNPAENEWIIQKVPNPLKD